MKRHDGHWLGQAKAVSVIDQKIFSPDLLVTFADICWVVVPAVAESTRFIFLPSLGGVQAVIQPIRGPIVTQSGDSSDLRIRSGVMDTHQLARLRRFLHDDFGQDGPQRPLRPTYKLHDDLAVAYALDFNQPMNGAWVEFEICIAVKTDSIRQLQNQG